MHQTRRGRLRLLPLLRGVLAGLAIVACAAGTTGPDETPNPSRVLFLGNSLTYGNELPRMVEALSAAAGYELETAMLAFPDFGLEDHWKRPETLQLIAEGDWDIVVLQQGPSSLDESRENLRLWTGRFAGPIRNAGAEPALYMVWPSAARAAYFARVSESYRLAARDVDGLLLPAGDAWRRAWELNPEVRLYGPDGFHPSEAGTYLAALTMVGRFYDHPLIGLPATLEIRGAGTVAIPPDVASVLQRAAAATR